MSKFVILQTFWDDVKMEMVDEKGLEPESADMIGEYVRLSGKWKVRHILQVYR